MGVHLSGVVASVATLPALTAFLFRKILPTPASIILIHISGAGFIVSLAASSALARHSTWVLGKGNNGTISLPSKILFWPYHAGLRAKLALQRRYSSEAVWDQITPTYYLGGWPSEEALVPIVRPAILDVTCELPKQVHIVPAYKMIPVWDTHSTLLFFYFKGEMLYHHTIKTTISFNSTCCCRSAA